MVVGLGRTVISELVLVLLILVVLYIIFRIGKALSGIIVNIILGIIAFFFLNTFFGLDIHPGIIGWIIVAVLGLFGAMIIVALNFLGVMLPNPHLLSLLSSFLHALQATLPSLR